MAITLKANVRWGGVDYAPGATIPGLTPSDEAGLVSSNRAEWVGTPSTTITAAVPVMATTSPGGGVALTAGAQPIEVGASGLTFSANGYGASTDADWETNRDAFNAACDAAEAAGGGRVIASPGTYAAKGLYIGSRVVLDVPGVTIVSPDGQAPHVVTTKITNTTGDAAGVTLTVADAARITPGTLLAIHEAGPAHDMQATVLVADIDSSQITGITLTTLTGFPTAGTLRIGSELIKYTGRTGGLLSGVTRGYLGTSAAAHTTAEWVHLARHHYAVAVAVAGNVVTLDAAVSISVVGADVAVGSEGVRVNHMVIDGNAPAGGAAASVNNFDGTLCINSQFEGITCRNSDQGGFMLSKGARNNVVRAVTLHDCGIPSIGKGSAFWMYQGCRNNRVEGITITGRAWVGIYLDDRTTTADGWDRANTDNVVTGINIDVTPVASGFPSGINVVGSSRNVISAGTIRGSYIGISISQGSQGVMPDGGRPPCTQNEFASLKIGCVAPYVAEAPGNVLHDIDFDDAIATGNPTNVGGNLVLNSKITRNQGIESGLKFGSGTFASPSVTFNNDSDTGLYSYGANIIGVALGGALKITLYPTEQRFAEGVHLAFGTTTGSRIGFVNTQKIAFWGGTPTTQPTAVANATDSNDAVTKLNELLSKLRSIGLIAAS